MLIPNANAHTPPIVVPTNAYVSVTPAVVGVGQYVTIVVFLDRNSPSSNGLNGQRWSGFMVNITTPSGATIILGPWICASAVASDFKTFTPTQVGTYKIVFSWPGETATSGNQPNPTAAAAADVNDTFLGATSHPCYLTVTSTPVPNYPEPPLPTGFWTTPINGINRSWYVLASNWLQGSWLVSGFQTVGTGPITAHVLWTSPITPGGFGGIADANFGDLDTNCEDYQSPWGGCIIMNGIIFYNTPKDESNFQSYGYYAVNLFTGQQIWYNNGTNPVTMGTYAFGGPQPETAQTYPHLNIGQMLEINNVNGRGIFSYLWEQGPATPADIGFNPNTGSSGVGGGGPYTTWYMLDPSTGNRMLTLNNVPSAVTGYTMASAEDAQGDLLIYMYNTATGNLLCWNSTQAIFPGSPIGTAFNQWDPPMGAVINTMNDTLWTPGAWSAILDPVTLGALTQYAHEGLPPYTMNVTIPAGIVGGMTILKNDNREPAQIFWSGFSPAPYSGPIGAPSADTFYVSLATINEHVVSYSPYPTLTCTLNNNLGFTVTMDYTNKFETVPVPGLNDTWSISTSYGTYDTRIFTMRNAETCQIWGYDLDTGLMLWGPTTSPLLSTAPGAQLAYYSQGSVIVYGRLFVTASYEGTITCYNATTGAYLWQYNNTAAPYQYESAYGTNMPISLNDICNGLIYTYSNEHSPTNPLWRQSYTQCINVTTGQLVWRLETYMDFIGTPLAIADGCLVTASDYDNLIYCIGKGPSGMTVQAPLSPITMGQSFTITGYVTDQSPGAVAYAAKYGWKNGVACVSDPDQQAWMEYLYMNYLYPSNATGVPVTISVVDPNGNYVNLGTVKNDLSGFFDLKVDTSNLLAGPGIYKVIVNFAGSGSYGPSSAEAAFTVNSAPAVVPTPTPVTGLASTGTVELGIAAVIIVIVIIGIVLALLMLRKRQ